MTKTPPMITSKISIFVKIATALIAPPSASEPVSPINTFAGCALNTRNPKTAPTTATQKIAALNWSIVEANTANAPNAIAAVPARRPSRPSVRFTAFEAPISINNTKIG